MTIGILNYYAITANKLPIKAGGAKKIKKIKSISTLDLLLFLVSTPALMLGQNI